MKHILFLILTCVCFKFTFAEEIETPKEACKASLTNVDERDEPHPAAKKAQEIAAFMSLHHPVQLAAISDATTQDEIFFWLHWSMGFQCATEPARYNPNLKGYDLDPKGFWELWQPRLPPSSADNYLSRRLSCDRFAQYLSAYQWETTPAALTKQIDALMTGQAKWSKIQVKDRFWRSESGTDCQDMITSLCNGVRFGLKVLKGIPRNRDFLIDPPRALLRIQTNQSPLTGPFFDDLLQSLSNPAVMLELNNFLIVHLPSLIFRRDDFQISSAPTENYTNLEPLKMHVLRSTHRRKHLADLRESFFKPINFKSLAVPPPSKAAQSVPLTKQAAPADGGVSLTELGRRAAAMPVESDVPANLTSVRELLALGQRTEKKFSEILDILLQSKTLSDWTEAYDRIRHQMNAAQLKNLADHLSKFFREYKEIEIVLRIESDILFQLQKAQKANKANLSQILAELNARIKSPTDVTSHDLSDADHLQSVLLSMLPLDLILEARQSACVSHKDLIQTTLRNLYAFGMELAASSVTDAVGRLKEILRPSLEI